MMLYVITLITILFIFYLIYKDPDIVNKSISYSYYEDRQTSVVWGGFGGVMGMMIAFTYPSPLTTAAGICLALVPIAGDFNRKPITYIHYALALAFYSLMLIYTEAFLTVVPYAAVTLYMLWRRHGEVSIFGLEVLGMVVILLNLLLSQYDIIG